LTIDEGVDSVRRNVTFPRSASWLGPRPWTGLFFFLALAASPAHAQDTNPPGSLTILSRPAGASCRIDGDRIIVGRTPLVMERGLVGRYRVRTIEPGYEPWQRFIHLSGATADTLWMELHPKSHWRAGFRSLMVPGWGQFYSDRPGMGWTWLTLGVVAGVGAVVANQNYHDRLNDINKATTPGDRDNAILHADDAYNERKAAIVAAASVWIVNSLDAMIFFPDKRTPLLGFEAGPSPNGEIASRLAVSVRF
jgi:hypothetical protein